MIAALNNNKRLSLTNVKWATVIEEFVTNGQNPVKAYEIAYQDCKTAPQAASRLFKNVKFVTMLEKRLGQIRESTGRTIAELDAMYQKGYNKASKQGNSTGMATNATGIARLYGMDKDAGKDISGLTINVGSQRPLTAPSGPERPILDVDSHVVDKTLTEPPEDAV